MILHEEVKVGLEIKGKKKKKKKSLLLKDNDMKSNTEESMRLLG